MHQAGLTKSSRVMAAVGKGIAQSGEMKEAMGGG